VENQLLFSLLFCKLSREIEAILKVRENTNVDDYVIKRDENTKAFICVHLEMILSTASPTNDGEVSV
jgi:hypothetical protein